jgi:hypothetical protein
VPVEIACDESGYEGEKLVGSLTPAFAHGSVRLATSVAADCVAELRARIRSPATEYKANHLQREKNRPVLEWFLGPSSPAYGNGRVFVVDKAAFLTTKLTEVLGGGYVDVQSAAVLGAANDLLRARGGPEVVDAFFAVVPGARAARRRVEAYRAGLPAALPTLDLLFPAIARVVATWAGPDRPVWIVHDRQKTLSPERVAVLTDRLGGRLAGLTLVGADRDPRVQLADILAGTVRKILEEEWAGHGDPRLTALARPFVDPASVAPVPV